MNEEVEEILEGKECAVAFAINPKGEARLVVLGDEPLVMFAFVKLVQDLADQDELTFDEALNKIKYYHDTCEATDEEKAITQVEQLRRTFKIVEGKKDLN